MLTALIPVVVTVVVRSVAVRVRVVGNSMSPTLRDGQVLWAWRWRRVQLGDVVVFKSPVRADTHFMVKRCTGTALDPAGSSAVPPRHIWVSGDGQASLSSAEFGPLPMSSVVASRRIASMKRCTSGGAAAPLVSRAGVATPKVLVTSLL